MLNEFLYKYICNAGAAYIFTPVARSTFATHSSQSEGVRSSKLIAAYFFAILLLLRHCYFTTYYGGRWYLAPLLVFYKSHCHFLLFHCNALNSRKTVTLVANKSALTTVPNESN